MALEIESPIAEETLREIMAITGETDIEKVLHDAVIERLERIKQEAVDRAVRVTWVARIRGP